MKQLHYISTAGDSSVNTELHIPANHNRLSLVNVSFAKSYYLIKDGYNTFKLDAVTHTIPIGNYDIDSFLDEVNTLISPDTISFSSITGKITLTSSATELIFPSESLLYKQFGFNAASTNSIGGSLESINVCDFQALSQVYVCCNIVDDTSSHEFSDLLTTFFVNDNADFSNIVWYNPQVEMTGKPLKFKIRQAFSIPATFSFLDQNGKSLDLNGGNVHICLVSWNEDEDFNDIVKQYIKIRLDDMKIKDYERSQK